MTTVNTVLLVVIVVGAALAAITFGIGALIAIGREGSGGPPRGSLERDEDDEEPHRG